MEKIRPYCISIVTFLFITIVLHHIKLSKGQVFQPFLNYNQRLLLVFR